MNKKKTAKSKNSSRPPIVVVLGHVDHGKTTLLDYIRKTQIAVKEAGGITQSISVSQVTTKGRKSITFIDTPGHAAFSNMRSRGAKLADSALLVIASDDGVKPQTKEALRYIREAEIPYIVVATKSDLPTALVEKVRSDLEKENVQLEGSGGDTPLVSVSGKTGKGVAELIEMIVLVSELNNVKGSKFNNLEATVVETSKDKRGPIVTAVIRDGKIKVGDELVSDTTEARVRAMFDWKGSPIREVLPGYPVQILGFSEFPVVGSPLWKKIEKQIEIKLKKESVVPKKSSKDTLPIVVKAENTGSLEALLANLEKNVFVVSSGVGDVNESDVFLAKSSDANIYAFESKVPSSVKKLAETEGVSIHSFNVIYELFDEIRNELAKGEEVIIGRAKIAEIFPYEEKEVAGCRVVDGKIKKSLQARLERKDKQLGEVRIISMRKGKEEIIEANKGEECGILFTPQLDFKAGDDILSVTKTNPKI